MNLASFAKVAIRRLLPAILSLSAVRLANSQIYNITTVAGGGMPVNVAGVSASLTNIYTIATDSSGNIFMANGNSILRLDKASGILTLFAGNGGTGYAGDNGPAVSAQLNNPSGLAVDSAGNVYISDTGNYRIRKVSNGVITTIAGTGTPGYPTNGAVATATPLASPAGLAVDSTENIYFADGAISRVYKISNGAITIFAGTGTVGSAGDNGPATAAELEEPTYLALDSAGNLYITDVFTESVREVSNGIITTVAGTGVRGYSGDGGPAIAAQLQAPAGIAVSSTGILYISDAGNSRIRAVSKGVITTVAGTGARGFSGDNGSAVAAELNLPAGIAFDAAGDLFIADTYNYRIRRITNGVITTVAGSGADNLSGIGGIATAAQIFDPENVAVDSNGDVYFYESGLPAVLKVANGILTTFAGGAKAGFSGDNGPAAAAQLTVLGGIALDSAGNLYIVDGYRIREISNGIVRTIAGTGVPGPSGDGIPALSAQISPGAIALDTAGNVFFMDGPNGFSGPSLRKISSGLVTTVVSASTLAFYMTYSNGSAILYAPNQIAVDSAGSVYIPDYYRGLLDKVSNGLITAIAGGGCGCAVDGIPADQAALSGPTGVAVDADGNLYISSVIDSRVRKVSGGVITTIAGTGTTGFSGDGGPAAAAELAIPQAVAVDPAGNVFVADNNNNRIRLLTPAGSSCAYSVSAKSLELPASRGNLSLSIQAGSSCSWAVYNLPAWLTSAETAIGTGSSSFGIAVAANAGAARTATFSAAGIDVTVTQAGSIPSISAGGIVNAASFAGSPLAPGSIVSAYGNFLGIPLTSATGSTLPDQLGGVSLAFGSGVAAPLFAVSSGQINFQLPWELANQSASALSVTVNGQTSAAPEVSLAAFSPGVFAMNGQGTGQGAVLDTSYRLVDQSNPALAGVGVIQIYCTGLGAVTNQPATGSPALGQPLSQTVATPAVTIGGAPATVLFSGLAPGAVGEYQVDALVPAGSAKGSAVPVTIQIGGVTSNTITIAVQ